MFLWTTPEYRVQQQEQNMSHLVWKLYHLQTLIMIITRKYLLGFGWFPNIRALWLPPPPAGRLLWCLRTLEVSGDQILLWLSFFSDLKASLSQTDLLFTNSWTLTCEGWESGPPWISAEVQSVPVIRVTVPLAVSVVVNQCSCLYLLQLQFKTISLMRVEFHDISGRNLGQIMSVRDVPLVTFQHLRS